MRKLRIMNVFGTRPEAVKMAPLVKVLKNNPHVETLVCVTAQHRQMLDQVLRIFGIVPDYDLNIMVHKQSLEHITIKSLEGLSKVLRDTVPDIVLVHGDTTTTLAASLAAFYQKIKIGHVEAGLRTFDKYYPYPEEMNRTLTGVMADLNFCPTLTNKRNLLREGINEDKIYITGNTVIDALKFTITEDYAFEEPKLRDVDYDGNKVIVVTAHRRENIGDRLHNILTALKDVLDRHDDVRVVYPVHPNPDVKNMAYDVLGDHKRAQLVKPIEVQDMHNLIQRSYLVVTDSGGLQEEAPALGKPVLVVRSTTERPEAVAAGTVKVVGTNRDDVTSNIELLINNSVEYAKMAKAVNPYGDGRASERIRDALLYEFGISDSKPAEFTT